LGVGRREDSKNQPNGQDVESSQCTFTAIHERHPSSHCTSP
jgi:hypothetical protein